MRTIKKMLPWLLLIPAGVFLPRLLEKYPDFVEKYYAQLLYPYISRAIASITTHLPFSLAEFLLYALVFIAALALLRVILLLFRTWSAWADLLKLLVSLGICAGVLLNLFYLTWGLNYFRPTLYTLMDLPVRSYSIDELEGLCYSLAKEAASVRKTLPQDEDGVFTLEGRLEKYLKQIPRAYETLGKEYAIFSQKTYPVKQVAASKGLSYAGISGIYIGITAEANINAHQPDMLLLSAAAHESAHYLGVAREDEANFVSYLACISSDVPQIRYSGLMLALINCSNRLYALDAQKHARLRASYSDAIRRDLAAHNAYWESFEGPVEEKVNELNDSYLKHNGQESGVAGYGMMVDLLLAYTAKNS